MMATGGGWRNRWGRLSAAEWFVPNNGSCAGGGHRFTERYDYSTRPRRDRSGNWVSCMTDSAIARIRRWRKARHRWVLGPLNR